HGATRKNIEASKRTFFDNDVTVNIDWSDRFWLYYKPTFEGWQHLFDHELEETLTDRNFQTLNYFLCGQLADYYFCIEDQDHYFKTTFGETYDACRKCPLRINGEA